MIRRTSGLVLGLATSVGVWGVTMFDNLRNQLRRPHSSVLRENLLARVAAGQISESSDLSSIVDSLDLVALEMEIDEFGMEPSVHVRTVGDLLWLLKAIEFQRSRKRMLS